MGCTPPLAASARAEGPRPERRARQTGLIMGPHAVLLPRATGIGEAEARMRRAPQGQAQAHQREPVLNSGSDAETSRCRLQVSRGLRQFCFP